MAVTRENHYLLVERLADNDRGRDLSADPERPGADKLLGAMNALRDRTDEHAKRLRGSRIRAERLVRPSEQAQVARQSRLLAQRQSTTPRKEYETGRARRQLRRLDTRRRS